MNITQRVEEIVKPYIQQPAVPVMGHFATGDTNTYNTINRKDTSFDSVMYSIGILHRDEFKIHPELLDAVIERVQKEMQPSVYTGKVEYFTK